MKIVSVLALVVGLAIGPHSLLSQNSKPIGGWGMYFGSHELKNPKWLLYTEVQFRERILTQQPEQLLMRAGLGYVVDKHWVLGAGAAAISNYQNKSTWDEPHSLERRLFLQQIRVDYWHSLRIENRFREEFRSLSGAAPFRIRHRLLLSLPLSKMGIKAEHLRLHAYNEAFIQGATTFFDRNRLYIAVGYKLKHTEIQLGYMKQTVLQGYCGDYVQLGLFVF